MAKVETNILPYNRKLVLACGGNAVGMGCIAIIGWLADLPLLRGLGQGLIPMAPSTAFLFIMYGSLIMSAVKIAWNGRLSRLPIAICVFGGLISATLLVLSLQGVFLDMELLGIASKGTVKGSPIGHMSPVTAAIFLLFSIICPVVISASAKGGWRVKAAWWAAIVILAANFVLLLAYLLGTPMFYGGRFIPPAATTCIGFVSIYAALASFSLPLAWPGIVGYEFAGHHSLRKLVTLFLFLSAGIVCAGYFYHGHHERQYLDEKEGQLSAIADLKLSELTLWREERLADAGMYHGNAPFASLVKSYLLHPESERSRRDLRNWLEQLRLNHNYDGFFLLDSRGKVRLSFREKGLEPLSASVVRQGMESLSNGNVTMADFYLSEHSGKIQMSVLVPLFDPATKGAPLAVLVMRIDPGKFLYPFIQRWPGQSKTAETLLVRREGENVLFLNDIRFQKGAALQLSMPLTRQDLPAVIAVQGTVGIVTGKDYRNRPVIAALRAIPDSPWYLVTKMDKAEIYAPLRERQWITVLLVSALLLCAGAFAGVIWRQQRASHYKHYLEQTQRSNERLQSLLNVFQHESGDVKDLLDFALHEALAMTASRYGYIYLYDENRKLFILNSWSNDVMQACAIMNPQTTYELDKTGLWGEAVRQRAPVVVNDFSAENQYKKGYPDGHVRLTRFMTIPLIEKERIVAVIGVANKETVYDETDVLQLSLLMGSVWKIAERENAEMALKERERRLKKAEELAHLGHWRYDLGTGRIIWSDEMFRIFGLRRKTGKDGLTVENIARYCHPEDRNSFYLSFDPESQDEGRVFEYRIIHPGGEGRHVLSMGEVERDEHGTVVALFGTVQDTTELRQKERELQQKNAEMERFTYTVSHDLKSPLVTVKSFVGFLERDMLAADQDRIAKDLDYMKTATDRMSLLLDQVLEMSRVGKVVTPPVKVLFSELVQQALDLLAGSITQKGIMVQPVCSEPLILYGDRPRLVEVWQNLIENAIKYMGDQPSPQIEIGFEMKSGVPVFYVADNGIGIDQRYHAKIFSLFDKLDSLSEGTGLGLALARRIVEMYEGKIWVESAGAGAGSSFRFTLPRAVSWADLGLNEESA